jgi:UDP-galactopyranose mutase
MEKTDFLIIGCGLYGSVLAERIANILKKKVIILEKRDHIAGNIYSHEDPYTGIEYHKYGTHIFHTSHYIVWKYINQFTTFNSYRHQSLAKYKNKIYQLPINLETINSFFGKNFSPDQAKNHLIKVTKKYKNDINDNFESKALSQIGKDLYEAFIKNYTRKQWGKNPIHLPSTIFNRLPLRFNYDETYQKNSKWSGVPEEGYTNFIKKLLENKKIEIKLNQNFNLKNDNYKVKYFTIYTGPLDKIFNYQHGKLDWRSLKFEKKIVNTEDFQGNSVINFPELKYKFTRIHEPKHLHPERTSYKKNKSIIIKEYPIKNNDEPYYPINDEQNREKQKKYALTASRLNNFLFGGRLANYAYYDMDMTISAALHKFEKIKKNFL